MAFLLSEDVILLIKNLIQKISGYNDGEDSFKQVESNIITSIRNAESIFFTNKKDIDRIIESLCHKFIFHGFTMQSKELNWIYQKFVPQNLSKQERINRLNVVNFLLGVSESPTNNIHKHPLTLDRGDHEEDVINWPQYLLEDIPKWSTPPDDDSDCWSGRSSEIDSSIEPEDVTDFASKIDTFMVAEQIDDTDSFVKYHHSKANLLSNVQSDWFLRDHVYCRPISTDKDANVALLWDNFVQSTTQGLIPMQNSNILSEYKIMREVIWQLHEPHSSSCFQFVGNMLVPKLNVTISSVRMKVFETFLYEFVPYINWLQTLREFHESLIVKEDDVIPPETYRGYDYALQTIIRPIFDAIQAIENKIRMQETTSTLLTLAHEIRPLFQTIQMLKDIHCNVVLDFKENSPLVCATTLLCRLHKGLLYTSSKLEQDLYLSLYLHSLYKYFTIINSWLSRDILDDHTGEFVIVDDNPKEAHVLFNCSLVRARSPNQSVCCKSRKVQRGQQDWQMEFFVKALDEPAKFDSMIALVCTQVLQVGKNIHLLRLLGKLQQVPEFTGMFKGTLYEAYIEKILESISEYFNIKTEIDETAKDSKLDIPSTPTFVFPATCPDECKYLTEMDRLENLVDTSNGFLVNAFESFFIKKPEVKQEETEEILFERISKLTKNIFPVQQMLEHGFVEILKQRYSTSGLMVKNVLMEDYNLQKQFLFLKNVFLFSDDLIFPLYRRIFQQLDSNGNWGNHAWLTSHLQDVVMDAYPNFYKECTVEVKDNWKLCNDPLKACRMVNINYRIRWPINIIIRDEHMEMYKDLFGFILKIKWALYTLNHLYFTELEPKGKPAKTQKKSLRKLISKLKTLRFGLINLCSSIQHYVLGHIFSKFSMRFDKALEDAYDLESLLNAHANFVQSFYKTCSDFQEYNSSSYGFDLLLYLVRKLRIMWKNLRDINDTQLETCEKSYLLCHKHIDPIINPSAYCSYVSNH